MSLQLSLADDISWQQPLTIRNAAGTRSPLCCPTSALMFATAQTCCCGYRAIRCVRDSRSKFVAGVSTSYGGGFGFHHVCNDGGINTYAGTPEFVQVCRFCPHAPAGISACTQAGANSSLCTALALQQQPSFPFPSGSKELTGLHRMQHNRRDCDKSHPAATHVLAHFLEPFKRAQ